MARAGRARGGHPGHGTRGVSWWRGEFRQAWREAPGLTLSAILVVLALLWTATSVALTYGMGPASWQDGDAKTALFVDAVSDIAPNGTLVAKATRLLQEAGYRVDYHPAENATVDFFGGLPEGGHDLIILRVHSTAREATAHGILDAPVNVFTAEPYSRYTRVYDQFADRLRQGIISGHPEQTYFAFTPAFVSLGMEGRFADATILMMGCAGLANDSLASAFVETGARAYVAWDQDVTASRTDAATLRLLEGLLDGTVTLPKAIELAMDDLGPDPEHGSRLRLYP